jgi:hypothetical protein
MSEPIWFLEDRPVRVSFNTKGYAFYKGGRGILGTPIEAYLRLIAVKGSEKIEIPRVSDLKARVIIESPAQALQFVRLFTSLKTHYLFPEIPYVEPSEAEDLPDAGEYTKEYAERIRLKPATSKPEGNGFIVERNLLDSTGKLFRATERVGTDGGYALLKTTTIDEHSPVIYPLYQ